MTTPPWIKTEQPSVNNSEAAPTSKEASTTAESIQETGYEAFVSSYERGLLSLAYRHTDILTELHQRVTSDHFLFPANKVIYSALSSLIKQPGVKKIDFESLVIECNNFGFKGTGVNPDYLLMIDQGGYDRENFDFYLNKVTNAYTKFSLAKACEEGYKLIQRNCKDDEKALTGEELLGAVNEKVSKLLAFQGNSLEGTRLGDYIDQFVKQRSENPQDVRGLRTGFDVLDQSINGLIDGTLTVLAGMAKAGKSTVMLNIASYVAFGPNPNDVDYEERKAKHKKVPVLYISTEMNKDEDLSRLIALRAQEKERLIQNGTIFQDANAAADVNRAVEEVKNGDLHHVYLPDFNAAKVVNIIYHYKIKYNIGLAVFDYIKMATTAGDEIRERREDQVLGDIATALKNIAGKLNIPVLAGCQVNTRSGRIADSDRIERYCNSLIHFMPKTAEELNEKDFKVYGTHWMHVYRTRSGGDKKIPMRFFKQCCLIKEANPPEADGDEDTNDEVLLTTPKELQKMQDEAFRINRVNSALSGNNGGEEGQEQEQAHEDPLF